MSEWLEGLQSLNINLPVADSRQLFHAIDRIEGRNGVFGMLTRKEIALHLYGREYNNVSADARKEWAAEVKAAKLRARKRKAALRHHEQLAQFEHDEDRTAWLKTELERINVGESTLMGAMDADRSGAVTFI